ncbi:MAG TPA: MBG domain-containing protein, partial [Verrucomicrobiae bacterium]|nr:MBG domain-containing protein [Verrucomicrobiae bacterium]
FLGTDTVSVVSGTATISTTAVSNSPVGPYPITVTNGTLSANNYSFGFVNGTLTVGQATLLVTANNQSRLYEAANPTLTYGISGFLGTDTVSVVSGTAAISTTAVSNSPVGPYPITVTNGTLSANNYSFSFVNGTLTVGQATLLVTANNQSRLYEAANPTLTYGITGFLGTDTVSVVSGTPAISTTAVSNSPVGPYLITVTNGTLSANNYNFTFANGTLTVGQATLLVTANNQSRLYEAANPTLTYGITGFLGTDTVSVVSGTAAISTTAVSNSPVGPYPITVTNGTLSANNYSFTFANGTLTVGQATLQVTANNQTRPYGAANPTLTYNISGFLGADTIAVVSGSPNLSTTAIPGSPVGSYPVTMTGGTLSATNYMFALNNGTLTVTATAPTILGITHSGGNVLITWSALSNATYRVQYLPAFPGTNWQNLTPDVTATNVTASAADSPGNIGQRYYRVMVLP